MSGGVGEGNKEVSPRGHSPLQNRCVFYQANMLWALNKSQLKRSLLTLSRDLSTMVDDKLGFFLVL